MYQYQESLGNLSMRASKAIGTRLKQNFDETGLDISIDEWVVLVGLWEKDGRTQQELGTFSDRDKTNISRILDGLEEKELVNRRPGKKDRRKKFIHLTDKGNQLKVSLHTIAGKTLAESIEGLSKEEVKTCRKVLRTICQNLGQAI